MTCRMYPHLPPPRVVQGLAHTFGWLRIDQNTWEKPSGELVAFPFASEPIVTRTYTYHHPLKDTKTQR